METAPAPPPPHHRRGSSSRNVPQDWQSQQEPLGLHGSAKRRNYQVVGKKISRCTMLQSPDNCDGMSTGHFIVLEVATTTCVLWKVDIVPFAQKGVNGPMAFVCEADCVAVCKML